VLKGTFPVVQLFGLLTTASERFGTNIITETIARVDFSQRPFKYWTEGEEEDHEFMTADTWVAISSLVALC
jgi:hypothetical protein